MSNRFISAIRRATTATRASDPMAATRIIQEALSGAPQPEAAPPRRERLRKPLREALRTLREGRGRVGWQLPGAPAPAPAVPHGARFEARSFACAEGARDYRLYLPADTGTPLRASSSCSTVASRTPTTSPPAPA